MAVKSCNSQTNKYYYCNICTYALTHTLIDSEGGSNKFLDYKGKVLNWVGQLRVLWGRKK